MPDIESIKKEYDELLQQLSDPGLISNWEKFEQLAKRKSLLEKIIEKEKEIEDLEKKIEENKAILKSKEDSELFSLAETEIVQLKEREVFLQKELKKLLSKSEEIETPQAAFSSNATKDTAVIVEIRAGTGGEEASLFVADLFRMYSKYAQLQGWKEKVLDSKSTELGGFKEIIFELTPHQGPGGRGDVFSRLQYEGGVHRVQRIPTTEKSGRVHTSTVSVAILPKPKKTEIKIRPDDLKIDFYRSSGPGGQYVNKRETAVRITHLPSGLVVTSQSERNQLQNKENALSILEAKLLEKTESEALEKLSDKRRSQIKWAKRAEKIRTYNFPQDRVTDHRVKKSFHDIEAIMEGNLDPIVKALQTVD